MSDTHANASPLMRRLIIDLAIMLVIGVVLALLGPFGSFGDPIEERLVYWIGLALAGYALYSPISAVVVPWGKRMVFPEWAVWVASVLVATVPMTAFIWILGFIGDELRWPRLDEALYSYLRVLVIGAGITVVFHMLDRPPALHPVQRSESEGASQVAPGTQPRFIDRLSAEMGTDLIALEMEDHYVRAHTALGSELVLMRMRDAVAELEGVEGEQVHRSWWVARGGVADVVRDGRNVRLLLDNGIEAPVSRANVSLLKQRGWL
ncbi:LytTR family DNA-binding domain-containing protein [Aurantiacibacter poecillastricola]|uniref:LytTR family DNA-binding domain-containing protein n=1 Tax=Aurantiacibacter poecillastricola TaxID=3064385 RepID=UPI00273F0018|nr:LytTR family DNA-binding domain-containing protein [Aurantiacibacter sp. 219JJ12-13]MDP5261057.1 LytTR family DNA-binding domain-containing protein [Aurantiacibacter sp. 219JJ12-13]